MGQPIFDAFASGTTASGGATSISYTHVPTGTPTDIVIYIFIKGNTGAVTVSTCTYGGQSCALQKALTGNNNVRGEIWGLLSPLAGSQTVSIALSGQARGGAGSVTHIGSTSFGNTFSTPAIAGELSGSAACASDQSLVVGGFGTDSGINTWTVAGIANQRGNFLGGDSQSTILVAEAPGDTSLVSFGFSGPVSPGDAVAVLLEIQ